MSITRSVRVDYSAGTLRCSDLISKHFIGSIDCTYFLLSSVLLTLLKLRFSEAFMEIGCV